MALTIEPRTSCRFDLVALGEVMLRLDPGDSRVHTARTFTAWEGGGEYNVARGLKRCFGLETAVVTAFADNPIGRLVQDFIYQGGVDQSYVRWVKYDGVGRSVRNGLNFTERGFGLRGAVGCSDRGHTAASQLKPGEIDWETIFGKDGVRWLHTGGIFAALSATTPLVAEEAMKAAKKHGTIVSYDLNYRESLWKGIGGKAKAQEVNRELAKYVDVMIGNEEDFTAALGFEIEGMDEHFSALDPSNFRKMIDVARKTYPNFQAVATTLRNAKTATLNDWGAVCATGTEFCAAPVREDLEIYDRVGGGDSFASGLIYGFLAGKGPQYAVECGAAHGALAMTTPGDTSMASLAEIEHAMKGGKRPRVAVTKEEVLGRIRTQGVLPVLRTPTADDARQLAIILHGAGLHRLEIPLTVPGALDLIRELGTTLGTSALIGAGTVLSPDDADAAIAAGARYVIAPTLNLETIERCRQRDVAIFPGALTPTEILAAWQAGADAVKVFPANAVGGPDYVRAIKAPLPFVKLMPTGGVTLENIGAFLHAGAEAAGVGGDLVDLEAIRSGARGLLADRARRYIAAVTNAR